MKVDHAECKVTQSSGFIKPACIYHLHQLIKIRKLKLLPPV